MENEHDMTAGSEGESPRASVQARIWYYSARTIALLGIVGMVAIGFFTYLSIPPRAFPTNTIVSIEEGMTLREAGTALREHGVIRSELFFRGMVVALASDSQVVSGEYFFDEPLDVNTLVRRITIGDYGLTPVRVLIPEGFTVYDIASRMAGMFERFDEQEFLDIALRDEGYLFPDTYLFSPNVTAPVVHEVMRQNFDERIAPLAEEVEASGRTLDEIIIMASMLEKEAHTTESRRMIAGILWHRLDIDMPLQVDAVFPYFIGRNTFELTMEDLRHESPYNTYRYRGLPIGPIANPSMDSILAALRPIENPYLFYLSDMSGEMHYAETYEQHMRYRAIYLEGQY
jgi:UPF0755 protein